MPLFGSTWPHFCGLSCLLDWLMDYVDSSRGRLERSPRNTGMGKEYKGSTVYYGLPTTMVTVTVTVFFVCLFVCLAFEAGHFQAD